MYLANQARRRLARLVPGKRFPRLVDERLPTPAHNAFVQYIRAEASFPAGQAAADVLREAAVAWKNLPEYERRPYEERFDADRKAYAEEIAALRARADEKVRADKEAAKAAKAAKDVSGQ